MATRFPKLQIVWRNPQPVRRCHRCEPVEYGSNFRLYFVQEFLSTGEYGFWSTISHLEVVSRQMDGIRPERFRVRLNQSR